MSKESDSPSSDSGAWFQTTHWSVVWRARHENPAASVEAMEKLCRAYWRPLYAFIRRDGCGVEDARDLTQAFFARLLEKEWLSHLQDQRGKFRSFLLTLLKNFLSDERDRAHALKRGGGQAVIHLDELEAAEREALEPADGLTPDQEFERCWALALVGRTTRRLRDEYSAHGKRTLFDALKDVQFGERSNPTYRELGERLGLSEAAIKSAALRLRRRHAEIVREEIAQTVTSKDEMEDEIRHLMAVLGG